MKQIPSISRFRQGAIMASLTLMLAACSSSEEYYWEMWDTTQQAETAVSVITEDGTQENLKAGNTLSIYVVKEDGSVTWMTVAVNKDGNIILPPEAQTGKVIAYTPVQPGWGLDAFKTLQLFEVKADQSKQVDYDASDLMIGTIKAVTRNVEAELRLTHMMSKVMIHIIDETGSLDGFSTNMRLLKMKGAVSVNLSAMKVTTIEDSQLDIDMLPFAFTDRRITMAAIVAPQKKQKGDDIFEFKIEGGAHLRCALISDADLEGGKTFVYQMRYTDEGLVPEGSYITDWETDNNETDFSIRVKK